MVSTTGVFTIIVVLSLVISLVVVRRLTSPTRSWGEVLRTRFILGVPWGTVIVVTFVLVMYLFVQDGITDFHNPVTIPFRSWSYFYPLGIVTAPFAHANSGHLIGNLAGTIAVAPIAEYVWGHYRHSEEDARHRLLSTPWIRALVVFPLAVIVIGLLSSLVALGPVIGFSGVVFAFAGFAIVRYPILTIIATIGARSAIVILYRAIQTPVAVFDIQPTAPAPPGWATTAIQGHAVGFFLGILLAIAILDRRRFQPNAVRLWIALVLFGFSESLWAIYWFGGSNEYVLFQGLGVTLVIILALVVTLAITGSERSLLLNRIQHVASRSPATDRETAWCRRFNRIAELGLTDRSSSIRLLSRIRERTRESHTESNRSGLLDSSRRQSAFVLILLVVAAISGPAIAFNLFVVDEPTIDHSSSLTVSDYTIHYTEGTENELVSFVDVSGFGLDTDVESSGIIVSSDSRHLWMEAVTTQELAFSGEETIYVGGLGWREPIIAERTGWDPIGNESVYTVRLIRGDSSDDGKTMDSQSPGEIDTDAAVVTYESEPSTADLVLENMTVTIVAENGDFLLEIRSLDDGSTTVVPIPDDGESVSVDTLTVEHDNATIYGVTDGTTVQIASIETYS